MSALSARQKRAMMDGEKVPFPTRQLFVLAMCRICEPIAFMSIFPYIYHMIASFHVADDKRQTSVYAGMVTSAFAFAEFSAGMPWGRLSDRIGRKPVLLTGLAGTGLSMLIFGFAPNLTTALIARALGGLLNGNIGVIQTTVAEVTTVEAHRPRAFSIMPFIWCLGTIIGSGIGGTLAQPVKNYPSVFLPGSLFDRYPFLLPNLVCTVFVLLSLVIGLLFLEETHEDKKDRRDLGLELGQWILRKIRLAPSKVEEAALAKVGFLEETLAFLAEDDRSPDYRSVESSPQIPCSQALIADVPGSVENTCREKRQYPVRKAFTSQVILNIVAFGIVAFHTISFEQLLPSLLESKGHHGPFSPFKFMSGFGLPTKTVGMILSSQGFLQMITQFFVFPAINRRLGSLRTFRTAIFTYPFLYFLVPYMGLLPPALRMPGIYTILVWKVTAQSLAFPSMSMMLAEAAPSHRTLGTINGAASSSASLCRALGPTFSGAVHSAGLKAGYSGLSWWACATVALCGIIESLWMRHGKRTYSADEEAEASSEETIYTIPRLVDKDDEAHDPLNHGARCCKPACGSGTSKQG